MRICYLLESTDLNGGVRVVFDQARALSALGHEVNIRSIKGNHSWYPYPINVNYVERLDVSFIEQPDALICTYWTTVRPAINLKIPITLHLCQGYEGGFPELKALHHDIEIAYQMPIPKLIIGDWIRTILVSKFGRCSFPIFNIGQIVDTELFSFTLKTLIKRMWDMTNPNILIVGDYKMSSKGVIYALKAISILRGMGIRLRLTRVSLHPLCDEEKAIVTVDQSFVNIPPTQMVSVYNDTDILISPHLPNEGFGLPLAEAMSSGIPTVASMIPSFLSFHDKKDYACFVPICNPEAIARGVISIIKRPFLRISLIVRGLAVTHGKFRPEVVARNIEICAGSV